MNTQGWISLVCIAAFMISTLSHLRARRRDRQRILELENRPARVRAVGLDDVQRLLILEKALRGSRGSNGLYLIMDSERLQVRAHLSRGSSSGPDVASTVDELLAELEREAVQQRARIESGLCDDPKERVNTWKAALSETEAMVPDHRGPPPPPPPPLRRA